MKKELQKGDSIHFIGIGGIGMSGLARIAAGRGYLVSGTDMHRSALTDDLEREGIAVHQGHREEHLPAGATLAVRSAAVPDHNPEVVRARERGIPVLRYSEALGAMMRGWDSVCVAGTHGKTTTTAMISHVLLGAGLEPTYLVGGLLPDGRGNARCGSGKAFVTEACEYAESFLDLVPRTAVVTNIEADHLDYYGSFANIRRAFDSFISRIPREGLLVVNADDFESMAAAVRSATCRLITFGVEAGATVRALRVRERRGRYCFDLQVDGRRFGRVDLNVPGRHNVLNALAAAAVCLDAGAGEKDVTRWLSNFEGVKRRFEVVGRVANTTVISDYAHHPTEIRAALECARKTMPHRRLFCVFQPHQGSRTRILMQDFASAFMQADTVILPEIYYVRDAADEATRVSSRHLSEAIAAFGTKAVYLPAFEEIVDYLARNVRRGDAIVAMGAGTIEDLPGRIIEMLRAKFGTGRTALARRRSLPQTFEQIRKKVMRRVVKPAPLENIAYAT